MKRYEPIPDHDCKAGKRHHHPYCSRENCEPCWKWHRFLWGKNFRIREGDAYSERHNRWTRERRAKIRPTLRLICQTCPAPRERFKHYCRKCREAFRQAAWLTYHAKIKRERKRAA